MNLRLHILLTLVAIAMFGCADIRPENLDKSQREAVSGQIRSKNPESNASSAKDQAILRVVGKSNLFDNNTIVSSLSSVKDEEGHQQLGLMDGVIKKSLFSLSPGTYTIFVTCTLSGAYNQHLLKIDLAAGSDRTVFCMPEAGRKLIGLNTISAVYAFVADTDKFEDSQARARQEIQKGQGSRSCGSNCRELPLD